MFLYGKNDQSLMESGSGDLDEVFAQNLLEGYDDTSGHTCHLHGPSAWLPFH